MKNILLTACLLIGLAACDTFQSDLTQPNLPAFTEEGMKNGGVLLNEYSFRYDVIQDVLELGIYYSGFDSGLYVYEDPANNYVDIYVRGFIWEGLVAYPLGPSDLSFVHFRVPSSAFQNGQGANIELDGVNSFVRLLGDSDHPNDANVASTNGTGVLNITRFVNKFEMSGVYYGDVNMLGNGMAVELRYGRFDY